MDELKERMKLMTFTDILCFQMYEAMNEKLIEMEFNPSTLEFISVLTISKLAAYTLYNTSSPTEVDENLRYLTYAIKLCLDELYVNKNMENKE